MDRLLYHFHIDHFDGYWLLVILVSALVHVTAETLTNLLIESITVVIYGLPSLLVID